MRQLRSLIVMMLVVWGSAGGCGRDQPKRRSSPVPVGDADASRDASKVESASVPCSDWVDWLRAELETVPREVAIEEQKAVPPVVPTGLRPWLSTEGFVRISPEGVEHFGMTYSPLGPAAITWAGERIEGWVTPTKRRTPGLSELPVDIFADRSVLVIDLVALIDTVSDIEKRARLRLPVRVAFRQPENRTTYELPLATPPWVRTATREWREAHESSLGGRAKESFVRASGDCQQVAQPASDQAYGNKPEEESKVLAMLLDCECGGVDRDAFAGLLLGIVGYQSAYGVWPVAQRPGSGVRPLRFAATATVADLALELAKDPTGQPVHLSVR